MLPMPARILAGVGRNLLLLCWVKAEVVRWLAE